MYAWDAITSGRPPNQKRFRNPIHLTLVNCSVVDAVGKDRDPDASILFEQSADRNRLPGPLSFPSIYSRKSFDTNAAVSYTSTLTRQPAKGRAELHSGSKTPFWGLLKGFVADLMHVAGGKEP